MNAEAQPVTRSFFWWVVGISLLSGAMARLVEMGPPGFPLGEGGLFVLFSQRILDLHFVLPWQVQYGDASLPFAYPPAGFFLAAAVARITGAGLLDVYYYLPITLNLLAIPAFCYLARQFAADRALLAGAAILYVLLPESFVWQITGGGMPRALAAVLAILSIAVALDCATRPRKRLIPLCGVLIGLTILSHLEWGMFASIGVTFAFFTRAAGWRRVLPTIVVGAIAFAIIAPWLFVILSRHGFDPFLSSSSASQWNLAFVRRSLTAELFANFLIWPAILGMIKALKDKDWFLLAWAPVILATTPRMGQSAGLAIPTALLAAHGLKMAADFIRDYDLPKRTPRSLRTLLDGSRSKFGISTAMLALLLLVTLLLISPLRWFFIERSVVAQIDRPSRDAMAWIRREAEPASRFAVISDAPDWWGDRVAEWFPVLTGRASLTTAQGLEWAGPGVFVDKLNQIKRLKAVQGSAPAYLPPFVRAEYCNADYVAVFSPPGDAAREAFLRSEPLQLVYANSGAAVFKAQVGRSC